jgi:hypothetical protein
LYSPCNTYVERSIATWYVSRLSIVAYEALEREVKVIKTGDLGGHEILKLHSVQY